MAFLVLLSVAQLIKTTESSSCSPKEFTETPIEVQNSCSRENMENRWKGELSYTRKETYIEVHWTRIVQDALCVKAMEFFVDGVKQKDIWGGHQESVRIDKSGEFSLKVEVYFLIPGTSGDCYWVPEECKCFEATKKLNVPEGDEGTIDNNQEESTNNGTPDVNILAVAGAFAAGNPFLIHFLVIKASIFHQHQHHRLHHDQSCILTLSFSGVLFILLLIALGFCAVKFCQRRRFQRTPKVDVNDMYGTYSTSDQQSDYSTVQDTNDYYG